MLLDFTHRSKTGRLCLCEAGHIYRLLRAVAYAATKRELVAMYAISPDLEKIVLTRNTARDRTPALREMIDRPKKRKLRDGGEQFDDFLALPMSMAMDCIFCQIHRPILAQTKLSVAFLDSFPVSTGHALVIPKRHVVSIWEMTTQEYMDAFDLVRQVTDIPHEKFAPQAFNVGVNCGEAAGQTVFHAHIHIIPRYTGDVPSPRGGIRNIIPGKGSY
jgi:diadenosine tetraphosphate (Ap4A) HIT family hydrolase